MRWGTYNFFLKAGGDQMSLSESWSELHLFFLRVRFLPSFEKAKGIVRVSFPYLWKGNCLVYSVHQCAIAMFTRK